MLGDYTHQQVLGSSLCLHHHTHYPPPQTSGSNGSRGLRATWQTLEWGEAYDEHLIFDHASWFWRTMGGSTLLRDGSSRGVWLKFMWGGWTWLMWQVVVSCTCSVASSNMGSMRMHIPTTTAQLAVTWHSWQWRWMYCCCFRYAFRALFWTLWCPVLLFIWRERKEQPLNWNY